MRHFIKLFIVVAALGLFAGCAPKSTGSGGAPGESGSQSEYTDTNYYYDFQDILIPRELEYVDEESYTLDNRKFRAGIMKFKGRVVVQDLIRFFLNNMAKDNWEKIASVKGKISVLSFEKFNKSCIIQIEDTFGSAKVTIIAVEAKEAQSSAPSISDLEE
ncbi:hypothetical protein [Desulfovibrio oxyclinae]|uniref:hypothetical protein n=1 Tax=Desulfovibrio oxyclinae TaxID=63560 RepID=UPI00036A003A|nr:hypothetical protein [Desulfovibrio oxyclinae]